MKANTWLLCAFEDLPTMAAWLNHQQSLCAAALLDLQLVAVIPDREGQQLIVVAKAVLA
jgi:hypothetical protein